MSSFRNRRNFSSPSLETLPRRLPPPIPTGKGSRSAADPEFSEYVDITKEEQVPDLILPEHVRSNFEEPAEIDYRLLLAGDDDSVQRLLRSAADFGVFMMIGHGLCSEEVKSTLIENQWAFEKLSKSSRRRYVADHEEFVWCRKTAENAENDKNLHIFCQNMNKVAENLEQMGKELAAIMITRGGGGGNIKKLSIKNKNNSIEQLRTREDCESHLIVHKYYQTTDTITDQLNIPTCSSFPIITNIGQKVISLRFYLLLEEAGEFFFSSSSSSSHAPAGQDVCFSFFARQNPIAVAVGDYFNQSYYKGRQNIVDSDEFKNAILFENLKFKPEIKKGQRDEPLFLIELQWSSSSSSDKIKISGFNHHPSNNINPAKKFITLSDQILILLLLIILYKTFFLIIFLRF